MIFLSLSQVHISLVLVNSLSGIEFYILLQNILIIIINEQLKTLIVDFMSLYSP